MMPAQLDRTNDCARRATSAQHALERVCSGAGLEEASRYYSPRFVDHVNDLVLHGLAGAERSVALYKSLIPNLAITVQEQVVEGERVVSRFIVTGTSHGRRVRVNGMALSRFRDGLIAEDWSVIDTLGLIRQLGLWRSALVLLRTWRRLLEVYRSSSPPACDSAQ